LGYSRAAVEGAPTWMHIVVEKVEYEIANRRRVEGNKALSTEKGKRRMKRCKKSGRER